MMRVALAVAAKAVAVAPNKPQPAGDGACLDTAMAEKPDQELAEKVRKALLECGPDRSAIQRQLERTLQDLWTEALVCLEEALPHKKGDGSNNERLFKALRHRVLTVGNRHKRDLPLLLGCYVIQQVVEREVVQRVVVKGEGPWNLPPGVRLPGG